MRLAWLTDIHLNFVDAIRLDELFASVRDRADAVAISGDIAESRDVCHYLRTIEEIVQKPIYFVLGNHDFYRGSIPQVRRMVAGLASESEYLKYLTAMQVAELTPTTAIIGHDGWADGRLGDFRRSNVILSDHTLIAEIARWFDGFSARQGQSLSDDDRPGRRSSRAFCDCAGRSRQQVSERHRRDPCAAVSGGGLVSRPNVKRRFPSPFRL